jgi:hypothetical protein
MKNKNSTKTNTKINIIRKLNLDQKIKNNKIIRRILREIKQQSEVCTNPNLENPGPQWDWDQYGDWDKSYD